MLKENIWFNKLKKMIPIDVKRDDTEVLYDAASGGNRNLFEKYSPFDSIILSLFELSGYQNKNLLNSSLTMLRAMFGQRRDLI
jgi:hypothetical protein